MTVNKKMKSVVSAAKHRRRMRREFPYDRVARMWEQGTPIAVIAHRIGRIDRNNANDPYHSLRNFLHRMHKGYRNAAWRKVKLPHRVAPSTVKAARRAGKRAWA